MGFGDTFQFYEYESDDGGNYAVKLTTETAAAGGFGAPIDPRIVPAYPYNSKNMRHVWAAGSGTRKARVPMKTSGTAAFVTGGDISLHGESYTIQGAIGERRVLSAFGG